MTPRSRTTARAATPSSVHRSVRRRRASRRLASALVLLLPLLAAPAAPACGRLVHGTVVPEETAAIRVRPGQVFSLHWHLGVVPGTDHLPADPPPDPDVLVFAGADHVPPVGWVEAMGDGGDLYLVFRAQQPGTTVLRIANCLRCPPEYDSYRERRIYLVTVAS